MLAVGTDVVGRGDAHEVVAVLHRIHGVREVSVAVGQAAVEDFAAHQVVLDVALAVAPGEGAVIVLAEAHHDAGLVDVVRIVDAGRLHVPAQFALRVVDGVLRIAVPFEGAAHRVVPDDARRVGRRGDHVVDEVETVLELLGHLPDLGLREDGLHARIACRRDVGGTGVDLVGFLLNALGLAFGGLRIGDLNGVAPVGIETEDGNAAVRADLRVAHLVGDFLTAFLRHDADRHVGHGVAAVADDGRQRSDAVRVEIDGADLAGRRIADVRTGGAADGHGGRGDDHHAGKCAGGCESGFLEGHFFFPLRSMQQWENRRGARPALLGSTQKSLSMRLQSNHSCLPQAICAT